MCSLSFAMEPSRWWRTPWRRMLRQRAIRHIARCRPPCRCSRCASRRSLPLPKTATACSQMGRAGRVQARKWRKQFARRQAGQPKDGRARYDHHQRGFRLHSPTPCDVFNAAERPSWATSRSSSTRTAGRPSSGFCALATASCVSGTMKRGGVSNSATCPCAGTSVRSRAPLVSFSRSRHMPGVPVRLAEKVPSAATEPG
mmetsp:Transcript_25315/g.50893  ORF Transcript_25315/g.50893 Transcript_25315/m.50893 type:complete len:200 (-) Transcript_25315:675-1274(-)